MDRKTSPMKFKELRIALRSLTNQVLNEFLWDNLTVAQYRALKVRFGLHDQVTQIWLSGKTKEAIRKYEISAMRKLQHPRRLHKLNELLEKQAGHSKG